MRFVKGNWIWAVLVTILLFVAWLQVLEWKVDVSQYDIYYNFADGQMLRHNENPYARVLEGDMSQNDNYTTIFPAFPIASYLTQRFLFHNDFKNWVGFWRWVFLLANLGTTTLIFLVLRPRRYPWLAAFVALIWGANRWILFLYFVSGLDPLPIFFLALALFLFPKQRWWSLASLSLSLALKPLAIFVVPLFLIEMVFWTRGEDGTRKSALAGAHAVPLAVPLAGTVIASLPALVSLPFLYWNWKGLVMSILFSVTRSQFQIVGMVHSVESIFQWQGFAARVPMLGLLGLVYLSAWRGMLGLYISALLAMLVFICFNPILFKEHMAWFMVCLPFAISAMMVERVPDGSHEPDPA